MKKRTALILVLALSAAMICSCAFAEDGEAHYFTPKYVTELEWSADEYMANDLSRASLAFLFAADVNKLLGGEKAAELLTNGCYVGKSKNILIVAGADYSGDAIFLMYDTAKKETAYSVYSGNGISFVKTALKDICSEYYQVSDSALQQVISIFDN